MPTIHVADGTYSRVSIMNDIALDVRSENGAASTVIDGGGTARSSPRGIPRRCGYLN